MLGPHSRNDFGVSDAGGTAMLTVHKSLFYLGQFIQHLCASLGCHKDTVGNTISLK